jgi:hypothetical protein
VCPVVVMQSSADSIEPAVAAGGSVVAGAALFSWAPATGS